MPKISELARQLQKADELGTRLDATSLTEPLTVDEAMNVQRKTLALGSKPTFGYKVAIGPNGQSLSAPIGDMAQSDGANAQVFSRPVIEGVEVEICFTLAKDLAPPHGLHYTRETLLEHVGGICSGVEFLAHRLDQGSSSPPLLFLADRLANAGYMVGENLPEALIEPNQTYQLDVQVNGKAVFSGPAMHPNQDPVAPFLLLANSLKETIPKGQVITTGSLCGAIAITTPCTIEISGFTTLVINVASKK